MPNSYIIASGHDNYLRYFKITPTEAINIKSLEAHKAWIRSLARQNDFLASGSDDSTLKLWKFNKNDQLELSHVVHSSEINKAYFWSLSFLKEGVIAAGRGQNDNWAIRVWDVDGNGHSIVCQGHRSIVRCLLEIESEGVFVSGCEDGSMKIWNIEHFKLMKTIYAHNKVITCMAYNQKFGILATVGNDSLIKFWFLRGIYCCFNSVTSEAKIMAIANFEKLGLFISGCENGVLKVWDWKEGILMAKVSLGIEIHCILCNEEEDLIITSDSLGKITVWKVHEELENL